MIRFILALALCLIGASAFAQSSYLANIHNAPGWEPSTSYTFSAGPPTAPFKRVNSGAGWTPSGGTSGTYNNGQPLASYQLTSAGTCTSAASGVGPAGSGTPITGTGITDGTCTWKYVGPVDYVSLTGWTLDNGSVWTSGTTYGYGHVVHTTDAGYPTYQMLGAGCVSTVKPTTTSIGNPEQPPPDSGQGTADGCFWDYRGQITYTSNAHPVPHGEFDYDSFTGSISGTTLTVTTPPATFPLAVGQYLRAPGMTAITTISAPIDSTHWQVNNSQTIANQTIFVSAILAMTIEINDLYTVQLWNDQEYLSGANGELGEMMIWGHNFRYNDSFNTLHYSPNGGTSGTYGLPITIKAAPGEDFGTTLAANPSTPLAGYNVNNGVGIRGTGVGIDGIWLLDNTLTISGLQFKNDGATGHPETLAVTSFPGRACNSCLLDHDLLEGAVGAWGIIRFGAQGYLANDLIISHGYGAINFDYGGRLYNSTIVCTGGACNVGVDNTRNWITLFGTVMSGNAIFGFTHLISSTFSAPLPPAPCSANCGNYATWQGTNNATDVASTDGSTYPSVIVTGPLGDGTSGSVQSAIQQFIAGGAYCSANTTQPGTPVITPGVCQITNSMSPSAAFATWPGNYRIGPSSTLYGTGAGYGNYNKCGIYDTTFTQPPTTFPGCTVQPDTPDILGTARPISGRYDIGAMQYVVTTGPFTLTGNSLASNSFTQGAPAATPIGAVIVGYTGVASGTTTVSLSSSGNAYGFRLDTNPYPGTNLICPSGGCPSVAGPITDVSIVATNSAAVGTPFTGPPLSLTGLTSGGPFTFTGNMLNNSTFVQGAVAPTVVGQVIVQYSGTATGTTTVSLSGANAYGFRLDANPYPGTNLICPLAGCPNVAGPITDVNLVATNSAATGSPKTSALSLTGISQPLLRVGIGIRRR